MRKINFKELLKKNWIHLLAFVLFFATTFIYFYPQFSGYGLKQSDVVQWQGAASEIHHFREVKGQEPLWTNSMFGGMPTYQISIDYKGNLLQQVYYAFRLWMDSPAGMFFVYLLGFYIMLLCMRVNPKLAILGAFAFAFSTYFILILQAGHNTKAAAIGFAPPVIGAFYMAYRYHLRWGLLLSALFMGLEIYSRHPQITYYLIILLIFMGFAELLRYIKNKDFIRFLKVTGGLVLVYVLALSINFGNLALTKSYAQYTIRGGNDITLHPDGTANHTNTTSGLDKSYITQWSYGIDETMTLLSPNVMGSGSAALANSQFSDLLRSPELRRDANLVSKNNVYWGNQPFTSGPVYVGIIVFFLAVLAMVYLKGKLKWFLFAAALLMIMLSWGKNFMGLTDFFIDYVPLYNKFRAVTIILAIVEVIIPLLAVLFLQLLFEKREEIKKNIKPFYIASGALLSILVILTFTGLGNGYLSNRESDFLYSYRDKVTAQIKSTDPAVLQKNGIDIQNSQQINQIVDQQMDKINEQFDALVNVRQSIYRSSMGRSIFFLVIGILLIGMVLKTNIKKDYAIIGLAVFIVIDLCMMDLKYLNNEKSDGRHYDYWEKMGENKYPLSPTKADKEILEMEMKNSPELKKLVENVTLDSHKRRKNQNKLWFKKFQTLAAATDYRVYDPSLGFNSARVSYFHKALNGYHGAKLRRIQNIKDFYINYGNMDVFNLLNVKYFIQNGKANQNPGALGPVWLVNELQVQPNPNQEILALGSAYFIENKSNGQLFINGEVDQKDTISGRENLVFLNKDSDSIPIDMSKIKRFGISSSFVRDINGNTSWVPNIELEKDTTNSFTTLFSVDKVYDFHPESVAIIGEKEAENLSSLKFSGQGSIQLTSYAPNVMKYEVEVKEPQFAVFSEMYYPKGWSAYIDGEEVDIHRVDYLLRGMELPPGKYDLEMRFEVQLYNISNAVSLAGCLLLFLLIGGFFVKDFLIKKKETGEGEEHNKIGYTT